MGKTSSLLAIFKTLFYIPMSLIKEVVTIWLFLSINIHYNGPKICYVSKENTPRLIYIVYFLFLF